jgi:hypothetical protein
MGFLGLLLLMLAGGYVLGILTASTVFRVRQTAYEAGTPEELPEASGPASSGSVRTRRPSPRY